MNLTDLLVFVACDCMVWPVSPIHAVNRCGRCGVRPDRTVEAPPDGKARPLERKEA